MDLYLQFGYGMKKNTLELARKWGKATVILSPRDIEPTSLEKWSKEFVKANVFTMFDPQCYYPHDNHKRLAKYNYHSATSYTNLGSSVSTEEHQLERIKYFNDICKTIAYIIPGIMNSTIDDKWFVKHSLFVSAALKVMKDKPIYMTISLPQSALMFNNDITERIISETEKWPVDGYYIVAEHPQLKYLVDDAVWMSNILDLCAGLKLQGKKVILGYANHQMLCASMTKIDAIASGTWLNVRTFKNKFTDEDDQMGRRNTWYYYPQALSEYKLTFLDLAFNNSVLQKLKPDDNIDDEFAEILFSGASPTSTAFNESDAFKHYLHSLKMQIMSLEKHSYTEAMNAQELLLETAERNIEFNRSNGIFGQDRDFRNNIDINRAALHTLHKNRGFVLEQEWNTL